MSKREAYGTPQEIFDDYWKELVTNRIGRLDPEAVKNELHDYYFLIQEVPKVYDHVTCGATGNPMVYAATINNLHDETVQEAIDFQMQDLYDAIKDSDDPDEIKAIFRDYAHVK